MLSANPDARAKFYLSTSEGIEREERQAFLVKFMSPNELDKHASLLADAHAQKDGHECVRLLHEVIAIGVTGWKNVIDAAGKPRPFTRAEIDDPQHGLTDMELWELAELYPSVVQISARDKVNLE